MRESRAIFLLIACCAMAGCRAESKEPVLRYEVKGVVESVDKRGGTVTIAHEDIPGYMVAMTMPFKVKDEYLLNELAAGDRITATLVVQGERSRLEEVSFVREEIDPSSGVRVEPAPGEQAPNFSLVNQDGERISLNQYRGRALVLTFIYTRCPLPDYCPLMTERFAEIGHALKGEPALYEKTHLLSISVDPEYDTPKVLKEYGRQYAADQGAEQFKRWEFASGSKDEVKNIAKYFGLEYREEADQIIHSLRTAIIAPDGKVVRVYRGNDWKAGEILSELRKLSFG